MSAFRDRRHAIDVITGFFNEEAQTDDKMFAGSGVIVAFQLTDLDVRIVLDASQPPQPGNAFRYYVNDSAAPQAATEFVTDSETFDKIYRGEGQPMMLLMSGKIKTKGDVTAAMRLLPAMARAIPHYKAFRTNH